MGDQGPAAGRDACILRDLLLWFDWPRDIAHGIADEFEMADGWATSNVNKWSRGSVRSN
jgi:hypothetical protein